MAVAPLSDARAGCLSRHAPWRGHSGAYAIQEKDDPYVRVVHGSLSNVIGLPLESLVANLRLAGLALPSRFESDG